MCSVNLFLCLVAVVDSSDDSELGAKNITMLVPPACGYTVGQTISNPAAVNMGPISTTHQAAESSLGIQCRYILL